MAPEGCAIGPDGELLDASEIVFFNDPDDDEPIAPATTSLTVQPSLDSFVTKLPPPARRSSRIAVQLHSPLPPQTCRAIPSSPVQVQTPYEPEPDPRFSSYRFRFRVRKIL